MTEAIRDVASEHTYEAYAGDIPGGYTQGIFSSGTQVKTKRHTELYKGASERVCLLILVLNEGRLDAAEFAHSTANRR
jgi:hypothetical protein